MKTDHRPGLSPEDDAVVREKARRMVGLGVLHQIQLFARRYQEEQALKRRMARTIAIVLAIMTVAGGLVFMANPTLLTALFRSFS